jgi:hypothetical protein
VGLRRCDGSGQTVGNEDGVAAVGGGDYIGEEAPDDEGGAAAGGGGRGRRRPRAWELDLCVGSTTARNLP